MINRNENIGTRNRLLRLLILTLLSSCRLLPYGEPESEKSRSISISGVQHLGDKFTIPEFYVEKYSGGPIDKNGGGTGFYCCVGISRNPTSKLMTEIRWRAADWSTAKPSEVGVNYKHVVFLGPYVANVPIEGLENDGFLYIHFFAGGKVRAVISRYAVNSPNYPIRRNDPAAGDAATVGTPIKEIFSGESIKPIK